MKNLFFSPSKWESFGAVFIIHRWVVWLMTLPVNVNANKAAAAAAQSLGWRKVVASHIGKLAVLSRTPAASSISWVWALNMCHKDVHLKWQVSKKWKMFVCFYFLVAPTRALCDVRDRFSKQSLIKTIWSHSKIQSSDFELTCTTWIHLFPVVLDYLALVWVTI